MVKIRALKKTDSRSDFRSGDPELDLFFRRYAGQNQFKHHIGTTVVAGKISGPFSSILMFLPINEIPKDLEF